MAINTLTIASGGPESLVINDELLLAVANRSLPLFQFGNTRLACTPAKKEREM